MGNFQLTLLTILIRLTSTSTGSLPRDISAANGTLITDTFPTPLATGSKHAVVPDTYIVKLKADTDDLALRDLDPHIEFHKRAQSSLNYTTRQEYNDKSLLLGLSLTLSQSDDIQVLKELDGVERVWPVYSVARPFAVANLRQHSRSIKRTRDGNVTLPYITGSFSPNSVQSMSNVEKLHAAGIKGEGIKIAVIDTGVDYTHPSLGGCFGMGCKISFGYDLVGDDYPNSTVTSSTPLVTCPGGGHGTHVMGIIGMEDAAGVGFGLLGVAPEATLGMYRVFGCSGSADTDVIISAMMMAAAEEVNVISMSLGLISASEADDPFETVTQALTAQGIAVIVAAGNNGDLGLFSPSAPGTGPTVLAVGSVENKDYPVTYQLSDSRGRHFRYGSVFPIVADPAGLSLIILADGQVSDTSVCLTAYYKDAAQLLVNPNTTVLAIKVGGSCTSTQKTIVAEQYGFKYVMLYSTTNDSPSYQQYYGLEPTEDPGLVPFTVTPRDSASIISAAEGNPSYKIFFNAVSAVEYAAQSPAQLTGGFMSNYSSFGPTTEVGLKPQLSAPGGNILSTWPLSAGGYAVLSGTSMATPFMAGCYALVKSQLPSLSVSDTFALLMNSASPLNWYFNTSILSTTVQQGAGLVNPQAALSYASLVTPQQISLGASSAPVRTNITIENRSTRSKTYLFTHKPAGLADLEFQTYLINQMYAKYATATFSTTSITIKAGASATVNVTINPPAISSDMQPVYSGYIIASNNNEMFTIPYVGEPWDPSTVNLIADIVPYRRKFAVNGSFIDIIPAGIYSELQFLTAPSYPDPGTQTFDMSGVNIPVIVWGSTQVFDYARIDVVAANTSFIPDKYGYNPNVTYTDLQYPTGVPITTIVGLDTVSTVVDYGYGPYTRSPYVSWKWSNTVLPKADYRLVLRLLRTGRDYNDESAWDSWMSAIVRIG